MTQSLLNSFALDSRQMQILLLFQKTLVQADIEKTADEVYAERKREWMAQWQSIFAERLKGESDFELDWFTQPDDYDERVESLAQPDNHLQSGIMLLELITFAPYIPLQSDKDSEGIGERFKGNISNVGESLKSNPFKGMGTKVKDGLNSVGDSLKNTPERIQQGTQFSMGKLSETFSTDNVPSWDELSSKVKGNLSNPLEVFQNGMKHDNDLWEQNLQEIAVMLGFKTDDVERMQKSISRTHDSITHKWRNLGFFVAGGMIVGVATMGAAAPAIAGMIGTAGGLSGAAAMTSGMAAIGSLGGLVAAGGMATGPLVLVGGGAILGISSGMVAGQGYQFATSRQVSIEAVKLEVVLKEIILQQEDTAVIMEILDQQRTTIQTYQSEIDRLRLSTEDNQNQINDLEKAVKILEQALRRNQELAKGNV